MQRPTDISQFWTLDKHKQQSSVVTHNASFKQNGVSIDPNYYHDGDARLAMLAYNDIDEGVGKGVSELTHSIHQLTQMRKLLIQTAMQNAAPYKERLDKKDIQSTAHYLLKMNNPNTNDNSKDFGKY